MNENVQIDAEEAEVVVHVVVADLVEETAAEEATDSGVVTKTATLEITILRTVSQESVYASHAGT